jgi:carbon starvation protein CstA
VFLGGIGCLRARQVALVVTVMMMMMVADMLYLFVVNHLVLQPQDLSHFLNVRVESFYSDIKCTKIKIVRGSLRNTVGLGVLMLAFPLSLGSNQGDLGLFQGIDRSSKRHNIPVSRNEFCG